MTDSDDTDNLLMIPPDLHMNIAEEHSSCNISSVHQNRYCENFHKMLHCNKSASKPSAHELSSQNLTLHNTHMAQRSSDFKSEFLNPEASDISSISHVNQTHNQKDVVVLCSTPKSRLQDFEDRSYTCECHTASCQCYSVAVKADLQKVSLSDMWQDEDQPTSQPSVINLKEEQLRRKHLQKTIRALQSRLLEYQQRLSVAIEVDRCKNDAITVANQERDNLKADLKNYKEKYEKLSTEHAGCMSTLKTLQKEFTQTVNLVAKFEQKNDQLQSELDENLDKQTTHINQLKKLLEELDIKYQVSKKSEENSLNEIYKLRDMLVRAEHLCDKYKTRCSELEREHKTLLSQKNNLQEFHEKQKVRADLLEDKAKSLQDAIGKLRETESTLIRKSDSQQRALKAEYQQQLENVVAKKLKEFQDELDKKEKLLKNEAREREREIAAKAVEQLQKMNEKSEQEIMLLQQKHAEEVELYRLQMENSSKKIDKLEDYLNSYKSKRTEIAEQLHDVMETQWQKALEILISPTRTEQSVNTETDTSENNSSDIKTGTTVKLRTPKSTRMQHESKENNLDDFLDMQDSFAQRETLYHKILKHNCIGDLRSPSVSPEQADRLQAYIDLCLKKSPNEIANLENLLGLTAAESTQNKTPKTSKNKRNNKPPWKS